MDESRERRRARGHVRFAAIAILSAAGLFFTSGCGLPAQEEGVIPQPAGRAGGEDADAVANWVSTQEGTDGGVNWQLFVGESADGLRCISLALDPKPSRPEPPGFFGPVDAAGKPIPLPPVAHFGSSGSEKGCAPAPSLTDGRSQPLYTLATHQLDGTNYNYAAGTVASEIQQVTVEFSDGTTAPVVAKRGSFFVIYPAGKKLAALRPVVPEFPQLRCSITSLTAPAAPGGPPPFVVYTDAGCTGYTTRLW